jgi:integrase
VNLTHGELRISGRRTKNGQQKVLYLSGEPLAILKEQAKLPSKSGHVFVDAEGEPLRYDAILDHFQQACRRAKKAEGFTAADGSTREPGFHDLRRTFARMANRAGIPHRMIMEIAGWKSEAMLLRYLGDTKPAGQRLREARDKYKLSTSCHTNKPLTCLLATVPGWRNGRR